MTLIALKDLAVTLGAPLFAGLSLGIANGDRIGLVAANGRGKSTLLRVIAGERDPTGGDITTGRGLRIGLVSQNVPDTLKPLTFYNAVLSALPPDQQDSESWRVDITLIDLAVPQDLWQVPLAALSGGWQRTVLLARTWVSEPDALLMDEPTNHLDLHRIGILENFLATLPRDMPVMIASHDRAFLDAVTNRTLFLRAENTRDFPLPFTRARLALAEADEADARRFHYDMKQAQQLRKQAAKLKNIGINSGSDLLVIKTKQLQERAEKLEAAARPGHTEKSAGAIRLGNSGTHAKALIGLDDVSVTTPDGRRLFQTGKLWISPGDRIVVLGRNGIGKSQLVRMIQAAIGGTTGAIRVAPTLRLGYSDQDLTQLAADATPLDAIIHRFDIGDQRARGLLAGAGMNIDLQNRPLAALSGGQKARLAMLVMRLEQPNFYLLDEPTNHLDIEGQEALEAELEMNQAACLLVSHDRSFVRNIANRFWLIDRQKLIEVDSPEGFFQAVMAGLDGS